MRMGYLQNAILSDVSPIPRQPLCLVLILALGVPVSGDQHPPPVIYMPGEAGRSVWYNAGLSAVAKRSQGV
jgi:hypothetical protein